MTEWCGTCFAFEKIELFILNNGCKAIYRADVCRFYTPHSAILGLQEIVWVPSLNVKKMLIYGKVPRNIFTKIMKIISIMWKFFTENRIIHCSAVSGMMDGQVQMKAIGPYISFSFFVNHFLRWPHFWLRKIGCMQSLYHQDLISATYKRDSSGAACGQNLFTLTWQ